MATVEQTMMKVQRILTGPMGLKVMLEADRFKVSFEDSSTYVQVRVVEWSPDKDGEPRSLVSVAAPLLRGVTPTPELYEWVARESGDRWFGHVEVHNFGENGEVHLTFRHTILGDFLDQPELEAVFWGILSVANTWDDELMTRFGGKRWKDA
jgi:hypothetical protein